MTMKLAIVLLLLVGSFVLNSAVEPKAQRKIIERPVFSGSSNQQIEGCSVTVKNLNVHQPLFLEPGTETVWPFSDVGVMEFSAGQQLELFCASNYSNPSGKTGSQTATCVSGTIFSIGGDNYDLTKVLCTEWPSISSRKTGATCNGGIVVESGFEIGKSRFIKQLEICFNEDSLVTRYVYHTLQPGSKYYETNIKSASFISGELFHGKNVSNLYELDTQIRTFDQILDGIADRYINTNAFLSRGHMAAKADFVYGTEQRGTSLYLNAAPQWNAINGGNWRKIEDKFRTWVSDNNLNVDCYTGVYGVTTLPNKSGDQTYLYLDFDSEKNGLIPVPKLYFRVIIQPSTKKGVVLIGVNNPYLTLEQIKKDYILCNDVSEKLTWVTWKMTNIRTGYSYACEVPDFAAKNSYLPEFDVSGLLY